MLRFLSHFTDKFAMAIGLWPVASFLLTLPILAFLYHRNGRLRFWSACGAYLSVLYLLGLVCFTLYPLPSGSSGPGITYGIAPQLDPFDFVHDLRHGGLFALLQIVMNIAFFIPLGFIAGRALRMRLLPAVMFGFLVSLLIETAQLTGCFFLYPYAYRTFDVDDLIWNTSGAVIGWMGAWLLGCILPSADRGELPIETSPGFVRRGVALCLDGAIIVAMTLVTEALIVLVEHLVGAEPGSSRSFGPFTLFDVAWLLVEGVIPWFCGGCTPGGGFVRMTFEGKQRTGGLRALFYIVRFAVLTGTFRFFPLAIPVLAIFLVVFRRMPYDYLP